MEVVTRGAWSRWYVTGCVCCRPTTNAPVIGPVLERKGPSQNGSRRKWRLERASHHRLLLASLSHSHPVSSGCPFTVLSFVYIPHFSAINIPIIFVLAVLFQCLIPVSFHLSFISSCLIPSLFHFILSHSSLSHPVSPFLFIIAKLHCR